jgi:hypothetical protein
VKEMSKSMGAKAREKRQARVAKVVWGIFLIVMGVLFGLDNLGRIDLGASSKHAARRAVDGNASTRWSSAFSDPQWITVDLGSPAEIARVKLNWQEAFATAYEIQASNDGVVWTTLKSVTDGDGGIDEYDVSAQGRYVRMSGSKRSTPWGYSLWEFEVYGGGEPSRALPLAAATTPVGLLSQGKTATSSSREGVSVWLIYWPLLIAVAGLPALLAPKDGGDQVIGFLFTGVGVILQLRRLDLTSWGFGEALPLLLILAGVMLVIQSRARVNGDETKPDGQSGSMESAS